LPGRKVSGWWFGPKTDPGMAVSCTQNRFVCFYVVIKKQRSALSDPGRLQADNGLSGIAGIDAMHPDPAPDLVSR
jgi:hypothetical protein